jgi:hypothetical protein
VTRENKNNNNDDKNKNQSIPKITTKQASEGHTCRALAKAAVWAKPTKDIQMRKYKISNKKLTKEFDWLTLTQTNKQVRHYQSANH